MPRQKNATTSSKGEVFEKSKGTPTKDLKKLTSVKKPAKVVVKAEQKKLEVKLKAGVDIGSVTTIDVTEKMRKKKVETHAEANRCPINGCTQKGQSLGTELYSTTSPIAANPQGIKAFGGGVKSVMYHAFG